MEVTDTASRGAVLFPVLVRFSSLTRPIREAAIDRVVEQVLSAAHNDEGLTSQEIREEVAGSFWGWSHIITGPQMDGLLKRLLKRRRLILRRESGQERYRLSDMALKELMEFQCSAKGRVDRVVAKLFRDSDSGHSAYREPFLEYLTLVFSHLAGSYVRLLQGELAHGKFLGLAAIRTALNQIKERHDWIDRSLFERAIKCFFGKRDPDYEAMKWNITQNYYIAHALGLGYNARLLSEEIFEGAVFYLDTNVLVQAATAGTYRGSFEVINTACRKLHAETKVCQITLDEYRRVPQSIRKQAIPSYTEALDSSPDDDPRKLFNAKLVDDRWFDKAANERETKKLVDPIRSAYNALGHHNKSEVAALHDALLLRWIILERERSGRTTWLITLDSSLPGFLPERDDGSAHHPIATTLGAFLQWVSPVLVCGEDEDKAISLFSEATRHELLPLDNLYELQDLVALERMERSCAELPESDVEGCVQYFRHNVGRLDPSESGSQAEIGYRISKLFPEYGGRYGLEWQTLKSQIAKFQAEKDNAERKAYGRSTIIRVALSISLFLVIEGVAIYFAALYGEGANVVQKVKDLFFLPTAGFSVSTIASCLIIGKERIRRLAWLIFGLFKSE